MGEIKRIDKKRQRQRESSDFSSDDFKRIASIVASNLRKIDEQDLDKEFSFVEFFEEFHDTILDGLSDQEKIFYINTMVKTMKDNPLDHLLGER